MKVVKKVILVKGGWALSARFRFCRLFVGLRSLRVQPVNQVRCVAPDGHIQRSKILPGRQVVKCGIVSGEEPGRFHSTAMTGTPKIYRSDLPIYQTL